MGIKTARTKEAKTQFVPYVAPIQGVASKPWALEWVKQRKLQGVDKFSCLVPCLAADGTWVDHPADSSMITDWMKHVLIKFGVSSAALEGLTSQGLKATALSWCSKFNLSIETRQLLGHHVLSSQTTCLTYSRDAQSGPLREYEDMLSHIRARTFLPDKSRSGRLIKKARAGGSDAGSDRHIAVDAVHGLGASEEEVELLFPVDGDDEVADQVSLDHPIAPEGSDSEESESRSSSDSSSSGSEVDCVAAASISKDRPSRVLPDGLFAKYMCRTSKFLHLKSLGVQSDKLRCGRKLSDNFELISSERANLLLGCAQCLARV